MSTQDNSGLTTDTLFLACTRPALWLGVPSQAAGLNLVFTGIVFVIMKNPAFLVLFPAIHVPMRWLISLDYNAFSVLQLWLQTKVRCVHAERWGGSTVSPLPVGRARKPWQVRVHV